MSNRDVFTYENNIKTSGQVASSDFARISVKKGGGENSLVQSCEVRYGQQIEEVTQVGSTQIFWLPGRPQGTINIGTLVGSEGFFSDWAAPCGKIDTASIRVSGGACDFEGQGTLHFSGAVVEALTASITTGRQTISQSATVRVGSMRTSGA
jgi:hypothetical protein